MFLTLLSAERCVIFYICLCAHFIFTETRSLSFFVCVYFIFTETLSFFVLLTLKPFPKEKKCDSKHKRWSVIFDAEQEF